VSAAEECPDNEPALRRYTVAYWVLDFIDRAAAAAGYPQSGTQISLAEIERGIDASHAAVCRAVNELVARHAISVIPGGGRGVKSRYVIRKSQSVRVGTLFVDHSCAK
jgi:hypothetical protein